MEGFVRKAAISQPNGSAHTNGTHSFSLWTAEMHVNLGINELADKRTKRAKKHFEYAIQDFLEIGMPQRAQEVVEKYGLGLGHELKRLAHRKGTYRNVNNTVYY